MATGWRLAPASLSSGAEFDVSSPRRATGLTLIDGHTSPCSPPPSGNAVHLSRSEDDFKGGSRG